MATRIVKVKNTGSNDTWLGQSISTGQYYTIQSSQLVHWAENDKVFTDIGSGKLVVNKGTEPDDDISDPTQGWLWLIGDTLPPRTADGDWHIVTENFAHVTGNEVINWTVEKYLDAGASFEEKFIIPNGRTFTLNFLEGGSFTVPTHIKLEYFIYIGSEFIRCNPEIRFDEIHLTTVNGIHSQSETVIVLNNANDELDYIEIGMYYAFKDGSGEPIIRKVVDVFPGSDSIEIDEGLPVGGISDGTYFGLCDRVIGQKANQIASSVIDWVSPPRFVGDGINYLLLTITNEDDVDAGLVTAMVNGWHTDTSLGD